ncbi:hypothetical protein O7602_02215 [Micromonospora sp. WMMD1128]|uniref:hypothetical protein n=1 Tax=Micromonospora sp. WMMD1128 TaxID=3015150 RepID=UPI00248B3B52|nr:hypothetical protein [Micromonospora sp. WMMD1128]WBB74395.1 hypothetical protein O7602_02215 [Micromonospora sp. WMMD1128]
MEQRADFSAATRRLIAQRAGFQCSVLNCGRLTVGPGPGTADVIDIGMAAHIYAAAPGGPRGTGGLPTYKRSSAENGIWCCYDHGKAIDSDGGNSFSVAELRAWKRLHEARKSLDMHGVALDNYGLVESISINSAPAALSGRKFALGMRNIIAGPNESGKTLLARLIGSTANPHYVAEISQRRDVDIAVRWFDPQTHHVATKGRRGQVSHILDGRPVPYVARPYKTIMLSNWHGTDIGSLTSLARFLDINTTAIKGILGSIPGTSVLVKEVQVNRDAVQYMVDYSGRTYWTTADKPGYPALIQDLVLVEIVAAHAQHHAMVEPTFLTLDGFLDGYHPKTQLTVLERLEQAVGHAQLAVISPLPLIAQEFEHWNLAHLNDRSHCQRFDPRSPINLEVRTGNLDGEMGEFIA